MKITKLETFHVQPRWLFLKISTDHGIVGFGEPIVEGQSKVVEAAIESLGRLIIGKDPRQIEHLWQLMYRGTFYRGGSIMVSAISGIEQALWDIKGKYYNMPVYEMLGGKVRNKIRVYCHLDGDYPNTGNTSAEHYVKCALKRKAEGFNFIKWGLPDRAMNIIENPAVITEMANKFAAVRKAVGDDFELAVDCHGRLSGAMAKQFCRAIAPYNPVFVEEPVLPENVDVLLDVKNHVEVPIASGERRFTKWEFRELIEKQAVDIVQPDCCHAGGILELKKIAAMAETYYLAFAPHNPLGPISLAACLQVDACTPNFTIQEMPALNNGWDRGVGYLKEPFKIENGYITVGDKPGLGIEIDEDFLEANKLEEEWETPLFVDPIDGSVRDW